jgi:hypothetical protein
MSITVITEAIVEASRSFKAVIAAALCLMTFLMGGVALFVSGKLVVSGDAAASAANIVTHAALFRLGLISGLIAIACYIAMTALVFKLFEPVNEDISLIAALFSLAGCGTAVMSWLFHLAAFGTAHYSRVLDIGLLQASTVMFLRLHTQAYNTSVLFFGLYCLLIGYLIVVGVNVYRLSLRNLEL